MIKKHKYNIFLFAFCCLAWMACTQQRQPCLTPKIASLNMVCMHKTTDTATVFADTALPTALLVAFTNAGSKGIIYPYQSANFTISLSSDSDYCKWGFTTDTSGGNLDTLSFFYQRRVQFISNACSFAYFYTLDSVHTTHRMIDSLHVINTNVTNNVNTTHLQIFIHPDY